MEGEAKHVFNWTIENFRVCTEKNGECLESPVFTAKSLDETRWLVKFYPKGENSFAEDFISCFLKRSDDCVGPDEVECDYTIEAIDGNNKSLRKYQYISIFNKGKSMGYDKFLERDQMSDSIMTKKTSFSYDTLTIRVTLKKNLPHLFSENSCWTKIGTDNYSFEWKVKKLLSSGTDSKLVIFSENLQFIIALSILEEDIEICLKRIKGFRESQKLVCSVALMDVKGEETNSEETIFETEDVDVDDLMIFPTSLRKDDIAEEKCLKFDFALSNGKTSESIKDIECELHDFSSTTKDFSASLKTDLKYMLANNVHADVMLHADQKVFRAHKSILCARSPVFMAMFDQDMVENQTGAITITDIEAATLSSLLEFMYTGDTEVLNCESALKLLLAADKYQVLSLKEKCASLLKLFVSNENVCDILFTADLIQQDSLKACAVNHIKGNSKKIFKSDKWKLMADKNLKLATDTFCEVSTH